MKKILVGLVAIVAAFAAQATVYRAGFRQGRFWLNNSKTVPSFAQDAYTANSWDWTLSAFMCNITGSAGANGTNPVSGKKWDWQNYYGYVYDGEMWMDAETTYTFGGNFDDGSAILVDGAVAWAQGDPGGTASGYNNWVAPKSYTPDSTGWHKVKLLVYDWEGGKSITCSALSATMWNTNGITTAAPQSDWHKFEDSGSGALFRAKLADTYFRVVTAAATANSYFVTIENLAPQTVEMKIFAGASDQGETDAGWTSESQSVSFAAGETKNIEFAWSGNDTPVYRIYLSGEDTSLLTANGFWEWSEARTFRFVPSVSAAFSATTATSATVSVTCGYAESMEGSSPDIAVTAYYGPVSGGHDPSAWANSTNYPAMQPGTFTDTFTCAVGSSCRVVFAASIDGGEPVWSDVLTFGASLVTISAPERILECEDAQQTITLTRGADDGWQGITVNLAYVGDTADFGSLPESVTFAVGETEKVIPFTMVDNDAADNDRTLVVAIAAGDNYVAGESASVSILVVDDETSAQVCEWTGEGDGNGWDDKDNWSTHTVPTKIDTVLFGDGVTANLAVAMVDSAIARLIRVTTANEVKLGTAATPSFNGIDVSVEEGAGKITYVATFAIDATFTITVAKDAMAVVTGMTGTGDMVKNGAGRLVFASDASRTGGTTYLESGRIEFGGNKNLLGTRLVVGGKGEDAVAYCTYGNEWNFSPFYESSAVIEIKDKGVFDLRANNTSPQLQTLSAVRVEKGGALHLGKTRINTGGNGDNFFIEGTVTGDAASGLYMQSGNFVVPATGEGMFVMDGGASVRTAHYVIADNPDVPVEMVLNGKIDSNNWPKSNQDGIVKQGDGVMRLTAENEFGGANNWQGTTKVSGGTLLVDNVSGSGTGKSWVWVEAGATLGGTGRIGGLQDSENARLSIGGSSEAAAVVHPGTIDDATGEHIAGMLTAGSTDQACPTAFNNYSKLAISVCERGAVDSLDVYGKVTISETGSVLDIAAYGIAVDKAKGGTYTILSATEGIVGMFATVQKPKNSWKVNYESEEVDGEQVVKRITLTVPGVGFSVIVR